MHRRSFLTLLGGAAAAWPLAARAQQAGLPVIGYLGLTTPQSAAYSLTAFRQGLGEAGYVERQNVAIEYRWAEGEYGRMPAFAAEFVRRPVTVIFAPNTTPALAAKAATSTLPIVFAINDDPVKLGLTASLNRPGGNATGVTNLTGVLAAKTLGLLHEIAPRAHAVAALVNPKNPNIEKTFQELQEAARILGLHIEFLHAATPPEIDEAFTSLGQRQARALMVASDAFFAARSNQITALAVHYRLPTIYTSRTFIEADGLISYSADLREQVRHAARYTGRILKGDKPADLPVMQPTKFELLINLRTAKRLGLDLPATVLALADEVVE
jgi:putative ABC transport system substrate-binding protein